MDKPGTEPVNMYTLSCKAGDKSHTERKFIGADKIWIHTSWATTRRGAVGVDAVLSRQWHNFMPGSMNDDGPVGPSSCHSRRAAIADAVVIHSVEVPS